MKLKLTSILLLISVIILAQDPKEYNGQWLNNKRHGQGSMTYYDGSVYTGNWFNNQRYGQGSMSFGNGERYEGNWIYDKMAGQGTYSYKNGSNYTGAFHDNAPNGQGVFNLKSGDTYTGYVQNGVITGSGTMVFSNQDKYRGAFIKGEMAGQGTMYYAFGDVYTGEWANAKRHGQGTQNFANGDIYSGAWRNDKMSGVGQVKRANGEEYTGEFSNNEYAGKGTLITASGDQIKGDFAKGQANGNAMIWYADGRQYRGEVKNGLPDGKGVLWYADGAYYNGEIKNGMPDGMGDLVDANGNLLQGGKWNNGKLAKSYEQIEAGRQALAEGLNALVGGLQTVATQARAYDQQVEQQIAANNAQTQAAMQSYSNNAGDLNKYKQQIAAEYAAKGYPINDPFLLDKLARERMQQQSGGAASTQSYTNSNSNVANQPNYNTMNLTQGSSAISSSNTKADNYSAQKPPEKQAGQREVITKYWDEDTKQRIHVRYSVIYLSNGKSVEDGWEEVWDTDGQTKTEETLYDKGKKIEWISWSGGQNYKYFGYRNYETNIDIGYGPIHYSDGSTRGISFVYNSPQGKITIKFNDNQEEEEIRFEKEGNSPVYINYDNSKNKKTISGYCTFNGKKYKTEMTDLNGTRQYLSLWRSGWINSRRLYTYTDEKGNPVNKDDSRFFKEEGIKEGDAKVFESCIEAIGKDAEARADMLFKTHSPAFFKPQDRY